jgi:hypothetical protein
MEKLKDLRESIDDEQREKRSGLERNRSVNKEI